MQKRVSLKPWLRAGVMALSAFTGSMAWAHDPGLSSANLALGADAIDVTVTFNERDLAGAAAIEPEALRGHGPALPAEIRQLLGRAISVKLDHVEQTPLRAEAHADANSNVEFHFVFPRTPAAGELTFQSLLLKDLPFGHRQAFAFRDESGRDVTRLFLSAGHDIATVSLQQSDSRAPENHSFSEFLLLGIRHILTGYDHLLFLFGLLVMCRKARTAALLITCFTAAHSITLALSTFGLVNLPSRYVEAAIAASILYVGLENLIRREPPIRGRALITFSFGLVHGLGFAAVLREMGVAKSGLSALLPLVGFNTGVEVGQLCVAALLLPLIFGARAHPGFVRFGVPACSVAVALAGACWLLARTVF